MAISQAHFPTVKLVFSTSLAFPHVFVIRILRACFFSSNWIFFNPTIFTKAQLKMMLFPKFIRGEQPHPRVQDSPFPPFKVEHRYRGVYERAGFDVNLDGMMSPKSPSQFPSKPNSIHSRQHSKSSMSTPNLKHRKSPPSKSNASTPLLQGFSRSRHQIQSDGSSNNHHSNGSYPNNNYSGSNNNLVSNHNMGSSNNLSQVGSNHNLSQGGSNNYANSQTGYSAGSTHSSKSSDSYHTTGAYSQVYNGPGSHSQTSFQKPTTSPDYEQDVQRTASRGGFQNRNPFEKNFDQGVRNPYENATPVRETLKGSPYDAKSGNALSMQYAPDTQGVQNKTASYDPPYEASSEVPPRGNPHKAGEARMNSFDLKNNPYEARSANPYGTSIALDSPAVKESMSSTQSDSTNSHRSTTELAVEKLDSLVTSPLSAELPYRSESKYKPQSRRIQENTPYPRDELPDVENAQYPRDEILEHAQYSMNEIPDREETDLPTKNDVNTSGSKNIKNLHLDLGPSTDYQNFLSAGQQKAARNSQMSMVSSIILKDSIYENEEDKEVQRELERQLERLKVQGTSSNDMLDAHQDNGGVAVPTIKIDDVEDSSQGPVVPAIQVTEHLEQFGNEVAKGYAPKEIHEVPQELPQELPQKIPQVPQEVPAFEEYKLPVFPHSQFEDVEQRDELPGIPEESRQLGYEEEPAEYRYGEETGAFAPNGTYGTDGAYDGDYRPEMANGTYGNGYKSEMANGAYGDDGYESATNNGRPSFAYPEDVPLDRESYISPQKPFDAGQYRTVTFESVPQTPVSYEGNYDGPSPMTDASATDYVRPLSPKNHKIEEELNNMHFAIAPVDELPQNFADSPIQPLRTDKDVDIVAPRRLSQRISDTQEFKRLSQRISGTPEFKHLPGQGPCRSCKREVLSSAKGSQKAIFSKTGELSGQWHRLCFTCNFPECGVEFNKNVQCYALNDAPYCNHHYHQLNNTLCEHCSIGIEGECIENELSQKWHLSCLRCYKCNNLIKQDYYLMNGSIVCERDAVNIMNGTATLENGLMLLALDKIEKRRTRLLFVD